MSSFALFEEEVKQNYELFFDLYEEIRKKNHSILKSFYQTITTQAAPSVAVIRKTAFGDSQESARRFVRLLETSIRKSTSLFTFLLIFFVNARLPCVQLNCQKTLSPVDKKIKVSCTYKCANRRLTPKYIEAVPYRYSAKPETLVMDRVKWVGEEGWSDAFAKRFCEVLSFLTLPDLSVQDWSDQKRIRYPDTDTSCFLCMLGNKLLNVFENPPGVAVDTLIKKLNTSQAVYVLDSIVKNKISSRKAGSSLLQCFVCFYDYQKKASDVVLNINFGNLVGLTDEGAHLSKGQIKALNQNLYYLYYSRPDNRKNLLLEQDARDHWQVDQKLVKHFQSIAPLRASDYSKEGPTLNTKPLTSLLASITMNDIFSIVSKNRRLEFLENILRPAQIRNVKQKHRAFQKQFIRQKYIKP